MRWPRPEVFAHGPWLDDLHSFDLHRLWWTWWAVLHFRGYALLGNGIGLF